MEQALYTEAFYKDFKEALIKELGDSSHDGASDSFLEWLQKKQDSGEIDEGIVDKIHRTAFMAEKLYSMLEESKEVLRVKKRLNHETEAQVDDVYNYFTETIISDPQCMFVKNKSKVFTDELGKRLSDLAEVVKL